jgi:hypothetical protein
LDPKPKKSKKPVVAGAVAVFLAGTLFADAFVAGAAGAAGAELPPKKLEKKDISIFP